ncbi:Wzz/FepE/Etk N-terminal domain-containing protein [Cesiribacter sp. SM1]|uniref:exopolysaccharide transport family protein n=1 Tax=Cesiribacter sp. SM1 TaxID=2861196 RepID=UPI001CD50E43|nr:Wzz/FepE/Etk N-terminal domain-containing protein [Cesiribacter sp. SM1]
MDLVHIFRILLKRLWLLITVPLITAGIAYMLLRDTEDYYSSTTQVATGITIREKVQLNEERFSPWEADLKFNNLIQTFKSPVVVGLLSYRLILHDLESPDAFRTQAESEDFHKYFSKNDLQQAAVVFRQKLDNMEVLNAFDDQDRKLIDLLKFYGYDYNTLSEGVGIERVKNTDYIDISYLSENPQLSAFVVNTFVDEFRRYHDVMHGQRSGQSVEFFATLVEEKRKSLDEKRELLRSYLADSKVLNANLEGDSKVSQIANIEREKQDEQSKLMGLELTLRDINKQLNYFKSDGAGSARNTRIVELQNKLESLNSRYIGSNNQQLRDSIDLVRNQIKEESAKAQFGLYGSQDKIITLEENKNQTLLEIDVSRGRIRSLEGQLAMLNAIKSDFADKKSTIAELEREVELASNEYTSAQEKLNAAKNVALVDTGNIHQVIYGQPAIEPEPSKNWIFITMAGLVSLFLCLVVVLLIEYVDLSIRTPQNFENQTRLPVAGTLNQINASKLDLYDLFHNTHKEESLETFKHLLRKLRFELEESGKQVFLFTSTKQAEGKSFVIMTLAYSLSLLHKRVLIIDTNFKHNTLTQSLLAKPQNTKLLNGYMANGKLLLTEGNAAKKEESTTAAATADAATETEESDHYSFISPTHHTNIDIIGSHVTIASPAEILSGKGFNSLMVELKHHYDYIFLEGASLNDYSDTKELIRYAEKVVAVFSAQSVIKQLDKESIRYLKELNGSLMGAVVNKVEHKNLKL